MKDNKIKSNRKTESDVYKIELRSEKVRNIIGAVSPALTRYGITIIAVIFTGLLFAAYYIPYPENLSALTVVKSRNKGIVVAIAYIPYRNLSDIKKGVTAQIEWEGYAAQLFGYSQATLTNLNDSVYPLDGVNYFRAEMKIVPNPNFRIKENMKGYAKILIDNKSVFLHILNRK